KKVLFQTQILNIEFPTVIAFTVVAITKKTDIINRDHCKMPILCSVSFEIQNIPVLVIAVTRAIGIRPRRYRSRNLIISRCQPVLIVVAIAVFSSLMIHCSLKWKDK